MLRFLLAGFFTVIGFHLYSQSDLTVQKVPRNPYYKYDLTRNTETITYYLSEFNKEDKLPLIIYVQGSGWQSPFYRSGEDVIPTLGHIQLTYSAENKAKVLLIEKPGVQYLDQMAQDQRNEKFDQKFSLESWSERIANIIKLVCETEEVDTTKIMVIGHSEGGVVAARVSKMMEDKISNVCIMAGEGPSQLYSLYLLAMSGDVFKTYSENPQERVDYLLGKWQHILDHPESVTDFFFGFTYKRWSSFLKTSVIDELADYSGSVYIQQGDQDHNVHPETAQILYTSLLSKGVDCQLEIMKGADHSFYLADKPEINGWQVALENSVDWFLDS